MLQLPLPGGRITPLVVLLVEERNVTPPEARARNSLVADETSGTPLLSFQTKLPANGAVARRPPARL